MSFNILICDDSVSMRKIIIKALKMLNISGMKFFQANNGDEALSLLNREWFDIIFTDINMPLMDGATFIKETRKDSIYEQIPIIVITSDARKSRAEELKKINNIKIITKPFLPETVIKVFKNTLEIEDER